MSGLSWTRPPSLTGDAGPLGMSGPSRTMPPSLARDAASVSEQRHPLVLAAQSVLDAGARWREAEQRAGAAREAAAKFAEQLERAQLEFEKAAKEARSELGVRLWSETGLVSPGFMPWEHKV